MSAIAGIFELGDRPVDRARLQALTRLPPGNIVDSTGSWDDGPIGLACALERITPESAGEQQPLLDPASGCVIAFDGRLDNRAALRDALAAAHADCLAPQTDAAYALAAFLEWGDQAPGRLIGDYALAIWDTRARRLLLARDPCGLRPLFYTLGSDRLIFASTLEQLLNDDGARRELNEDVLLRFLYGDSSRLTDETCYRGIRFLPGGHSLSVDRAGVRVSRYWHWPDQPPEPRRASTADVEEFREVFAEAVRCRLRSVPPVGLVLSGGLDSGSIASMAGDLHEREGLPHLRAYSAVFDQFKGCDERQYSLAASARYGFPHECVLCDDAWTLAQFEQWLPVFTEPFLGTYDAIFYSTFACARRDGVRVMLMGDGGDHLLTGTSHYLSDWLLQGRWRELHAQIREQSRAFKQPYGYRLAVSALFTLLPVRIQNALFYRQGLDVGSWIPARYRRLYRPETYGASHAGRNAWWHDLRDQVGQFGQGLSGGYKDRLMRLFGLQVRQPFFDVRLVQFILRTPPEAIFVNGRTKVLLRSALRDILPPLIRDRRDKGNYSPLLQYGLREKRRTFVQALLHDSELERRGYVAAGPWTSAIEAYLQNSGQPFSAYWRSLSLEMWLRNREGRLPGM